MLSTGPSPSLIPSIDPNWTVSELITRAPAALTVLHGVGIDACCGGALPLAEAARWHGVELELLMKQLQAAITSTS